MKDKETVKQACDVHVEELEQEFAIYLLPTLAPITRENTGITRRLIQSLVKCVFMEMENNEGVSERWQFTLRSGDVSKLKDWQMKMELRIFNRDGHGVFNERDFAMTIFNGFPTLIYKTELDKMGFNYRYELNMDMIDLVIEYLRKVIKKCVHAYRTKETTTNQIDPFDADMPGCVFNPFFIKRVKRLMYKDIIYTTIDGEWENSDKDENGRFIGRGERNALVLKHLSQFINKKKPYTILMPSIRLERPDNQYLSVGDANLGFSLKCKEGSNTISKSFNVSVYSPNPEWYLTKRWKYAYLTLMLALLLEVSEDAYENMKHGKEMKQMYKMEELKYGRDIIKSM